MNTATSQLELPPQSSLVSQPTPLLFFETMHAHQRTAALKTALDLELFTLIGEGIGSVAAIAKRASASERGVRAICDFLTVLGFLKKADNRYALTVDSAMFLDKNSPAYAGSAAKFLTSEFLLEGFKNLTEIVRAGGPAENKAQRGVDDPIWVEFARSMAPFLYMLAERTESLLHTAGKIKVLDIAAGHGLFGISFARHNPQAEIFALDSAPVLKVAEENAERSDVSSRWHAVPGDALELPLGAGYDVVLVPNLLHHWDRATIQSFLKKVRHALAPNGRIAVVEFAPNDDRVSPPVPASFVMNMLVTTPAGDAYPASEYRSMLLQSGFEAPEIHPLLPLPHTVFIARTR
ncbi:MAG TPA: class I SAM-dependent methyltransferase [Candidatus Acidoferrum sp.]|nr:class I SAM-dependent methyltransferase [Candidatus Acidoferrum sp.]